MILSENRGLSPVFLDWSTNTLDWSVTETGDGVRHFSPVVGSFTSTDTTGSADVIYAGAGADWVMAGGGNDVVFGAATDDALLGGEADIAANDARYECERRVA